MSTDQITETVEQRVERELAELRGAGILKKEPPTITRSTLERLQPGEQAQFFRAGGKLTNDPDPQPKRLDQIPAGHMLRSKFDAMSPAAQAEYFRGGGNLVDDADYVAAPHGTSDTAKTRVEFLRLPIKEQAAFIDAGGTITD